MKTEEKKENQCPDGQIQLLDGRVLDCYPSEGPKCDVDNELRLDTTGTYLVVGRPKKPQSVIAEENEEEKELKRLFLDNAFVLLANRERILSDSRMFLCPLPFCRNGLAYTGPSGFRNPTLGIYLEFWMACDQASFVDDNDEKWLLHHIGGSPLSGRNCCGFVNERGEERIEDVCPFSNVWKTFIKINSRYDKAKSEYDAYTLREVLSILEEEGTKVSFTENTHVFFLERAIKNLRNRLTALKDYTDKLHSRWHKTLLEWKYEELKSFMAEYLERKVDADRRLAQIQEERLAMKRRLKAGEISNSEYQRFWMPLHGKKDDIKVGLENFVAISLRSIFPDIDDRPDLSEILEFWDSYIKKGFNTK